MVVMANIDGDVIRNVICVEIADVTLAILIHASLLELPLYNRNPCYKLA